VPAPACALPRRRAAAGAHEVLVDHARRGFAAADARRRAVGAHDAGHSCVCCLCGGVTRGAEPLPGCSRAAALDNRKEVRARLLRGAWQRTAAAERF
jgi:hypothetical protein